MARNRDPNTDAASKKQRGFIWEMGTRDALEEEISQIVQKVATKKHS